MTAYVKLELLGSSVGNLEWNVKCRSVNIWADRITFVQGGRCDFGFVKSNKHLGIAHSC